MSQPIEEEILDSHRRLIHVYNDHMTNTLRFINDSLTTIQHQDNIYNTMINETFALSQQYFTHIYTNQSNNDNGSVQQDQQRSRRHSRLGQRYTHSTTPTATNIDTNTNTNTNTSIDSHGHRRPRHIHDNRFRTQRNGHHINYFNFPRGRTNERFPSALPHSPTQIPLQREQPNPQYNHFRSSESQQNITQTRLNRMLRDFSQPRLQQLPFTNTNINNRQRSGDASPITPSFARQLSNQYPFISDGQFLRMGNEYDTMIRELYTTLNGVDNIIQANIGNLEDVVVRPTQETIQHSTHTILYGNITTPQNQTCPISLTQFEDDTLVMRIRHCGHLFIPSDLALWFEQSVRCPLCRYDIRNYQGTHRHSSNVENNHAEHSNTNSDVNEDDISGNMNNYNLQQNNGRRNPNSSLLNTTNIQRTHDGSVIYTRNIESENAEDLSYQFNTWINEIANSHNQMFDISFNATGLLERLQGIVHTNEPTQITTYLNNQPTNNNTDDAEHADNNAANDNNLNDRHREREYSQGENEDNRNAGDTGECVHSDEENNANMSLVDTDDEEDNHEHVNHNDNDNDNDSLHNDSSSE